MDLTYLRNILRYTLSAVLSIVLVTYILYHISGGFQPDIETTPAALTTTDATMTVSVTIMRSETILYSPIKGETSYLFSDGSKVAIHTPVAEIYPVTTGSEELRRRIMEVDRQIRILESSNMSDAEKRTDTKSTDKLIRQNLYDIIRYMDRSNITNAAQASEDFLVQLNRRHIITRAISNYNQQIQALREERQTLAAGLADAESTITATDVGYFYSAVDGYETLFSADAVPSLTYRSFLSLMQQDPDPPDSRNGYPVGKLVTDYIWYIACEIDFSQLHNFETGLNYNVRFPYNNDISLRMYLYRILADVDSPTAVLIFRADILPSGFRYLRNQTVQVIQHSYTGYRIPASAVHIVNGQEGVYILRGSKIEFRRIQPLYEYDGYLIVKERDETAEDKASWLAKNDFVIVKGKDLYDGKIAN